MMPQSHTSPAATKRTQNKTGNARADTLLGLTEDFVADPSGGARPELRHYPAIAMAMIPYVDLQTRARVAGLLADCDRVPRNLAAALADDAIEAASAILERSNALSEGDMVRIIAANPASHAIAIARRKTLPATVIDALLARGHCDIDRLLERNHKTDLQPDQADSLSRRLVGEDEKPAAAKSHSGPPRMATALPDRTLAKLFWTGDRDAREAVMTVVARKAPAAVPTIPQQFGVLARPVCDGLVQLAQNGRAEDLIAGLARVGNMQRAQAARILADDTGEPLAITLAALQFDADTARSLIDAVVPRAKSAGARLIGDMDALGSGNAGRLLQALCGKPSDESARRVPHAGQVAQATRQAQPAARRSSGTPMRRHTDFVATTRAS